MIVCGRLIITVIHLATGKFTRIPPLTAAIILVPFGVVIVFVLNPSYCNSVSLDVATYSGRLRIDR